MELLTLRTILGIIVVICAIIVGFLSIHTLVAEDGEEFSDNEDYETDGFIKTKKIIKSVKQSNYKRKL